ncbi:fasciclin domain-containing protein [Rhizobiaceae bacterium]|nr:fasciclin domain-containing protein [Rhizobiaceae bacterium]
MNILKSTLASAAILAAAVTPGWAADIVDTAAGNEDFSTLVAAVQAAGLVDTLKGEGPFTVFAPTNDAFAKLPVGTIDDLLKPENKEKLVQILTYHVVPGKVMSTDLQNEANVATVEGAGLETKTVPVAGVNDALITTADIEADNGVIHVIDTVLMPPEKK